jgi:Uma2 family endonuclease
MGMPLRQQDSWTYEGVLAFIDEQEDRSIRYEFADGELLVTPVPGGYHQRIILALYDILRPYVQTHGLGEIRLGPSPVYLAEKTIFQPDLYIVPSVDGRRPRADVRVTRSLLVVEVLSPGSQRHDRVTKRGHYQRAGVPEYWIVDLDAEMFERWRPEDVRPEVLDVSLSWHPKSPLEPLVIDVRALFCGVRDDQDAG